MCTTSGHFSSRFLDASKCVSAESALKCKGSDVRRLQERRRTRSEESESKPPDGSEVIKLRETSKYSRLCKLETLTGTSTRSLCSNSRRTSEALREGIGNSFNEDMRSAKLRGSLYMPVFLRGIGATALELAAETGSATAFFKVFCEGSPVLGSASMGSDMAESRRVDLVSTRVNQTTAQSRVNFRGGATFQRSAATAFQLIYPSVSLLPTSSTLPFTN